MAACLAGFTGLFCFSRLGPAVAAGESASPKSTDPGEQNQRLGRGVNVLGYDPLWRSKSKGRFRAEHFALIREAGFNHVRINLHPFRDAGSKESRKISDSYWQTLDWAVEQALANKLLVILDFHEFTEMARDPEAKKDRFLAMWKQIAEHCGTSRRTSFLRPSTNRTGNLRPNYGTSFSARRWASSVRRTPPGR